MARSDRLHSAARLIRYAVYLSIAAMIWWLLSHFAFISLEPDDASVTGVSGMRRLLVERFSGEEPVERGEILVFAIRDADDEPIYRISRVHGIPGDRLDVQENLYTVNGESTGVEITTAVPLPLVIEEGSYFVLNDNPLSTFADSRRLGLIPRSCIIGRFLSEMP